MTKFEDRLNDEIQAAKYAIEDRTLHIMKMQTEKSEIQSRLSILQDLKDSYEREKKNEPS